MYCSHSLERQPCQLVTFALFISSHIGGLWSTGVSRKKAGHCSAKRGIAFLWFWCDFQIYSFFWHQSFASFRPTKFVPKKQPSPGVGKTGVSDVFFVPGPEKSLQFQDTIGLSSTSSWVLMALNPGYHGRESLTTENVGFGEGGFLFWTFRRWELFDIILFIYFFIYSTMMYIYIYM